MDDFNHFEPDPLLEQGSFIDPNPLPSNGSNSVTVDPVAVEPPSQVSVRKGGGAASNGSKKSGKKTAAAVDKSEPSDETLLPRPDWLPPDWEVTERVRNSGASKGSRDKYYKQKNSTHKFRSKKEVLNFLETGSTTSKRKNTDDADGSSVADSATPKRKKSEAKAKVSVKNFKFDDPPEKVKWVLSDIYEGTWRPLANGVDRVPESSKQEWSAAFTYITLQNGNKEAFV